MVLGEVSNPLKNKETLSPAVGCPRQKELMKPRPAVTKKASIKAT